MNVKAISINVGKALLVSALFMLVSIVVSLLNGRDSGFAPLLVSFIITLTLGMFPFIFVRKSASLSLKDGFLTIVLSWLLSFVFGMMPYIMWGGEFTLMNAWFESVSGYTTTGATILTDIEALPESLLFWRSSTHYIGGLGVVVFLLLVMPSASPYRLKLTNMEISSLSKEGYRYKSSTIVMIIAGVYIGLTVLATLAFWLSGMDLFDAVNHAFSVVSTGGFSTKNLSIAAFDSTLIDIVVMLFMFLSSIHFGSIYAMVVTRSLKPMKTPVIKYYVGATLVMALIAALSLKIQGGYDSWGRALLDASFNVVSYASTTGFAQSDNAAWPMFAAALLMFCSFQCGCSGSTTGGIKADRMVIFYRAISNEVKKRKHTSMVSPVKVGNHIVPDNEVYSALMYIVVFVVIIIISAIILMLTGIAGSEAFSSSLSCLSNVGPGVGTLGSMSNYSAMPSVAKLIYTIDMFLGRVEIYPVLVVLSFIFKSRN